MHQKQQQYHYINHFDMSSISGKSRSSVPAAIGLSGFQTQLPPNPYHACLPRICHDTPLFVDYVSACSESQISSASGAACFCGQEDHFCLGRKSVTKHIDTVLGQLCAVSATSTELHQGPPSECKR